MASDFDSDLLHDIFERQRRLHALYRQDVYRASIEGVDEIKLLVLAAQVELVEFLQLFPWKPWKRSSYWPVRESLLEEYADVLHFVVELGVILGITAAEAHASYVSKSLENVRRMNEGY